MTAKGFTRALIAFCLIYFPISELGATGSFLSALEKLISLSAMAWFGWHARDPDDSKRAKP